MKSIEQQAADIAQAFRHRMQEYRNQKGPDPAKWLRRRLYSLSPEEAALVGFRMAQTLRDTPAGDQQASFVHTMIRVLQ